ncbi:MAG: TonB-dependent receptor [Flavobacteriales bacterium]|nr:TonB-dependent receptor [Flavobacteriales bacterium]
MQNAEIRLSNAAHLIRAVLFVTLFFSLSVTAFSQGSIRGFVKNESDGEPVLFANVFLEGTTIGAAADDNGYYSISKIPAGSYTIIVQSSEHEQFTQSVTIENGQTLALNFLLKPKSTDLGTIEISSDYTEQRTQIRVSVETIRPEDFKRTPSFGGQPDLVQVLTTLPGFISTGDQGGQIYIRGGSPIQNKVLLDGMIVYNAFHSIGLFSVFDTDIIANADVYSGGFGAQFGGRISSVMDITTRDGNKQEFAGKIGGNPFGARVLIEGPLKKLNDNGGGISYMLSTKTSYLNRTSPVLYKYINNGDGLPFSYTDIYGKVSFGGAGSKFNVFGFSFSDDVTNYQSLGKLAWSNSGGGANFVVVPGGSSTLISGNFASSKYNIILKEETAPDRSSSIGGFNFGLDFKSVPGDNELKYGVEVVGFSTDYQTFNAIGVKAEQHQNTTELNFYTTYKISIGKWLVEPGVRIQYYGSAGVLSPEPRLGAKFKASERLRLKVAAGVYSQNLMAANSDRDVVNLFYGFLAGPDNLQDTFVDPNGNTRQVRNRIQKANHLIAGFEFDISELWNLNVEAYYRDFRQVTNTNRNKLFDANDPNNFSRPDELKLDFIVESGVATGIDLVMKYEYKRTYFWFVYSLGNVDRWDGFRWYNPVFDRRHNVNVVFSKGWGKNGTWEVSGRWNLGSGLPFTQTQGYFQPPGITDGIATDYVVANADDIGIYYAALNEGRLPYFHRMDINLRKTMQLSKKVKMEANVGVNNVYNRANVFYIDRVTGKKIDQLPILPSIGVDISF